MYDLAEQPQLSLLFMWVLVPLLLGDSDRGSIERVSYGGFRVISRAGPLMELCRLRVSPQPEPQALLRSSSL